MDAAENSGIERDETRVLAWGGSPSRDSIIAAMAARQYGVVTRAQLLKAGIGSGAIEHRLATCRLHRLHRGVYAVGHLAVPPPGRELAAVLACGAGAALSHAAAAAMWGIHRSSDRPIDISVAGRHCRSRPGLRVHRVGAFDPRDLRLRQGVPLTAPARTLLDLAGELATRELERAFDEALVRRLVRLAEIHAALDRAPSRRGARALAVLAQSQSDHSFSRSEAEHRLLALVRAAGLSPPQRNVRVGAYEVDFLWAEQKVVVEVDGYAFHRTKAAFERDRLRDADLQLTGFRVIRVTWRQLVARPEAVVARLVRALT